MKTELFSRSQQSFLRLFRLQPQSNLSTPGSPSLNSERESGGEVNPRDPLILFFAILGVVIYVLASQLIAGGAGVSLAHSLVLPTHTPKRWRNRPPPPPPPSLRLPAHRP